MDDFDSFEEIQEEIQEEIFVKTTASENETNDGTNLFLITTVIVLTLIHSFSDKWIDLVRFQLS